MKRISLILIAIVVSLWFQSCGKEEKGTNIKKQEEVKPLNPPKPSNPPKPPQKDDSSFFMILNNDEIVNVRTRVGNFSGVIAEANKNLNYQPSPVKDFSPDPHYNSGGVNNTANNGKILADDFRMAYKLGLAYLLTQDAKYAKSAQDIIDAWAKTLKSIGSAQGKSAVNFNSSYLIAAALWTKDANNWDSKAFDKLLKEVISPANLMEKTNNHGLWACFMEASIAAYFQDMDKMKSVKQRWEVILMGAVEEDGTMPKEMQRSGTSNYTGGPDKGKKGISYTHYALLPATMAAKIFSDNGLPVWESQGGKLLEKAYKKAAEWVVNPSSFPYYASNNGKLVDVDNAAYFTILVKHYPDDNAKQAILLGKTKMNGFYIVEMFK